MAASISARLAEIKLRYGGSNRGRSVHLAPIRVAELCRLFLSRYGSTLPQDDAGGEDARIMAHHLAMMTGDPKHRIASWMAAWAPWMSAEDLSDLIDQVLAKPLRWRADKLALRLNLTSTERSRLNIRTIGACDKTKSEREAARRYSKLQAQRSRRRAQGVKPRKLYEGQSANAAKPWEAEGISRRTWYRRSATASSP
jgi:hypothetical protein